MVEYAHKIMGQSHKRYFSACARGNRFFDGTSGLEPREHVDQALEKQIQTNTLKIAVMDTYTTFSDCRNSNGKKTSHALHNQAHTLNGWGAAALGRGAGKSGGLAHEARSTGGRTQRGVRTHGAREEGARSPGRARARSRERARGQTAAGTPRIRAGKPKLRKRAFYSKR